MSHADWKREEWEYEAQEEAAREEYEREVIEREFEAVKENAINAYFFYFGDAIEQRIQTRLESAQKLIELCFFGESVTSACIAIELTIRYFLLRPLCEAAFLTEDWAEILTDHILSRRSRDERDLLPKVLRQWDFDLTQLVLEDGTQLWQQVQSVLIPARNGFVHKGAAVERVTAECAVEVGQRLLQTAIDLVSKYKRRSSDGWAPEHCRRDPFETGELK